MQLIKTKKRDQHYVPEFYLKRFSIKNTKKNKYLVNTLFLAQNLYKPALAVGSQANKHFYYGEDGLIEDHLSIYEGRLASFIKKVGIDYLPEGGSQAFKELQFFVLFLDFRNPVRVNQVGDLTQMKSTGLFTRLSEDEKEFAKQFMPEAEEAIRKNKVPESLQAVIPALEVIEDLKVKLLINKTSTPFITSDYPVVLYNQFLEARSPKHIPFQLGTIGIQIIVPLDSSQSLMFFDDDKYNVGTKGGRIINVLKEKDVDQINLLQYKNASNAVYGCEGFTSEYAVTLKNKSDKLKKAPKSGTVDIERRRIYNLRTGMELSFIWLKPEAKKMDIQKYKSLIRPSVKHISDKLNSQDREEAVRLRTLLESHKKE